MDEIADRLDARPPRWRLFEEVPGHVGQTVGLAVATAEEIDEGVRRQVLHGVLESRRNDHVRQAAIANDAIA